MKANRRVQDLVRAFEDDGHQVDREAGVRVVDGRVGIVAVHRTARTGLSPMRKKAYYVEGPPRVMGYLMGLLAEAEIARMCTDFTERIVFAFLKKDLPGDLEEKLGRLLRGIVAYAARSVPQDLPAGVKEELRGLREGCREANRRTKVRRRLLGVLNYGVDALLAFAFTGLRPERGRLPRGAAPANLRIPFMCNGFSLAGELVEGGGHLMGRDFMFATAGVFQETACHIIRRPDEGLPTVSVAAPGMVGGVTVLNSAGVGGGVDIAPSAACQPSRPGFNSLLLLRHCVERGATCEDAVRVIQKARRGVSWAYFLAGGPGDRACVVEAVRSGEKLDVLAFPPEGKKWRDCLPDADFLAAHPTGAILNGTMVRWSDSVMPRAYLGKNQGLFELRHKDYHPEAFGPRGYLNRSWRERNCPGACYFAPQREAPAGMILLSNHFLAPEMRLTAMDPWTDGLAAKEWDQIQWRYDELHQQLLAAVDRGPVSAGKAREIIDFLSPCGKHKEYYGGEGYDGSGCGQMEIEGAVSLLDLRARTIRSHFGYHGDEWVGITLPAYLPAEQKKGRRKSRRPAGSGTRLRPRRRP